MRSFRRVRPERTTEADMPRQELGCAACNVSLRAQSPKHTRVAGSCRFPHIDSSKPYKCLAFTAAEDKYMNPRRNAKGHTHVEGECRYPIEPGHARTGHHPRDPRQPSRQHPSSEISGYDAALSSREDTQAASSSNRASSSHEQPDQAEDAASSSHELRRGRGPDQRQRTRRTFAEREQGDERLPDWSKFNIQISLKNLRSWGAKVNTNELRKLHLR